MKTTCSTTILAMGNNTGIEVPPTNNAAKIMIALRLRPAFTYGAALRRLLFLLC